MVISMFFQIPRRFNSSRIYYMVTNELDMKARSVCPLQAACTSTHVFHSIASSKEIFQILILQSSPALIIFPSLTHMHSK